MPYIQNALSFTLETVIGLYLIAVILRFLFQLCRVDFRNPISQMIVTITNPPLKFLRRFIPGLFGIDMASAVLIVGVGMIKTALLLSISGYQFNLPGVAMLTLGEVINIIIWTFIISILITSVLSWIAPRASHPVLYVVSGISNAVLNPFRRLLPAMSGIDFSPLLALLALNLAAKLIVHPLTDLGRNLIL